MMARLIERTFHPDKPLVARRRFVAAGRHFRIGDEFPWRKLPVTVRQAGLLFNSGKVMHPDEGTAQRPAPVAMPEKAPEPAPAPVAAPEPESAPSAAPTIEQETQDEDIHHTALDSTPLAERLVATRPEAFTGGDALEDLNMKDLRAIAEREEAPARASRVKQIEAIRENRRERQDQ